MKPKYKQMSKRVLLLNASEEVVNIIEWNRAVKLLYSGKALEHTVDEFYEIRLPDRVIQLPKIIILRNYIRIPYRRITPTRKNIFLRDQYSCQYCEDKLTEDTATIDHVTPRSKGGGSTWENMVTCCRRCNLKKANNYPKDVGLKLHKKPRPPLVNVLGLRELIELNKCWSKFVG